MSERKIVSSKDIIVCVSDLQREEEGQKLSRHLDCELVKGSLPEKRGLYLRFGEDGLSLTDGDLTVRGDFSSLFRRIRPANLNGEKLVRAVRFKNEEEPPLVVDATAGMGEDAFLLAAAGCRVEMFEYNPVIAALVRDAMERAKDDPNLSPMVQRMHLREEDSLKSLPNLQETPDVVYLDPMFPQRQKSGLIKKKFQLLQQLEIPCSNEQELLDAARAAHPRKITVKRPAKGAFLAGIRPSYSLGGTSIRYDCIVLR